MAMQARVAAGEEAPFVQLVEELLGIRVVERSEAELLAMRARIDDALPGPAPLAERVAAFRDAIGVPSHRVIDVMRSSADRFRSATLRDLDLPGDEGIDWETAHDKPWSAFAEFTGAGRTTIRINVDLPRDVSRIPGLVAHETYPGHHAEHITKERSLVAGGYGEATLRTLNTPESVLSEGQADVAREVVMSDWELADELRTVGRQVGVNGDWAAAVTIEGAMLDLEAAACAAALMIHRDGRPDAEVRAFLDALMPQPPERLAHLMRVLHDPTNKTYEFTYVEGARFIRPWLELQGQTAGYARLLSEQLSPAILLDDLAAAGMQPDGTAASR